MEDKLAIEKCLNGDVNSFEVLVKRYEKQVSSIVWMVVKERDDTFDIVQDSFVAAFFNLNRFEIGKNFKNWILAIAYNKSIDFKRKENTKNRYLEKINSNEFFQKNGEGEFIGIENSETFAPLIEKLSEKERCALVMQLDLNMSAREIGVILNCSENTSRVHLFNARKKLKKMLSDSGESKK